ncbi:Myotubularin-related protein 14 [Sarcoptes scabiei]|uniref:Myotubularin-related protein 14 n=1 Tax=Sarcoptes scabiei TaxID=52283 RepID=A0A834R6X1_SARSC|nr:Myotubularin-related protein 14 [Sarcoptes scabiei]
MSFAETLSKTSITSKEIRDLLNFFSSNQYKLKDTEKRIKIIEDICLNLISRDYLNVIVLPNNKGQLSSSYPSKIVIPSKESEKSHLNQCVGLNENNEDEEDEEKISSEFNPLDSDPSEFESDCNKFQNENGTSISKSYEVKKLIDLISKARVARCRARFPIPAILYKDKYICRSATLSSAPEIYGRSVFDYTFNDKNHSDLTESVETYEIDDDFIKAHIEPKPQSPNLSISDTTKIFSHFRNHDIKLLKYFSVKWICDLMLEKKKVKFGMNVTSSEKADKKNRYSDFNILSLPYPGCEFFREYRDNRYSAEGLIYDWNQDFVDAEFGLLNGDEASKILNLNFEEYRSWDVIRLTQNYIKLMLYFLREFDSSILIHCISGWDRTPLFISLLRLTLWADGEIHKSLSAAEITYLTVAYDWFLFGHNLNDRLHKGEEIMFFCFQFLKFIVGDEFSINNRHSSRSNEPNNLDNSNSSSSKNQSFSIRKISIESLSTNEDFIFENIPANNSFKGDSSQEIKQEDSFSLVSASEIEFSMKKLSSSPSSSTRNDNLVENGNGHINLDNHSSSPTTEMISTLTLEDAIAIEENLSSLKSIQSLDNHSSTKPVEIPNSRNYNLNSTPNQYDGSLGRSDSWQFVSEASSIIDNHFLHHHYSSPDSITSLNKKSISPINCVQDSNKQTKNIRDKRLLEVRSLFNSAYTSINVNQNGVGCSLTNFVDQIYRTVNI